MKESKIEARLRVGIGRLGGIAYKFTSPGRTGVPDRLVLLPSRAVYLVETKAKFGILSVRQKREHAYLASIGYDVKVLSSPEQVDNFLRRLKVAMRVDRSY